MEQAQNQPQPMLIPETSISDFHAGSARRAVTGREIAVRNRRRAVAIVFLVAALLLSLLLFMRSPSVSPAAERRTTPESGR